MEEAPQAKAITARLRASAHHEVLHPVAELVDEQNREVMHRLPQLDPGEKQFKVTASPLTLELTTAEMPHP